MRKLPRIPYSEIPPDIRERYLSDRTFGGPRGEIDLTARSNYNHKVLIGNCFEDAKKFLKHRIPHKTTYQNDYEPNTIDQTDKETNANVTMDSKLRAQGSLDQIADFQYETNFASLYDLSYNRAVPQLLKYPSDSRVDYTRNYVPAVNKGYLTHKRKEWQKDIDLDDQFTTIMRQDFTPKEPFFHGFRMSRVSNAPLECNRIYTEPDVSRRRQERVRYCEAHPKTCGVPLRLPTSILPQL